VESAYRYTFFTKAVNAEDAKEDEEEAKEDPTKATLTKFEEKITKL